MRHSLALALTFAIALLPAPPDARACGGFFSARLLSPEDRPSLSREKVLLVHDEVAMRQHFVREVAFRRASEPFGFVVPTPTRPEVAAVEHTPFTKLRERFPFRRPRSADGIGFGGGSMGSGGSPRGVEVLEVERVGSFTAFVLAADDADALARWLRDNALVSTPQADRWLEHYVRMGFYYVAMRYEPPESGAHSKSITAETIRISFDTPLPYYPYLEPEPAGEPSDDPRLLELWFVGRERVVPVALREQDGERRWLSPFERGLESQPSRRALEFALRDELEQLLPSGETLVVQTFQDQKRSRLGWGDIVFAPAQARPLAPAQRDALQPLLGCLDPALVPEAR